MPVRGSLIDHPWEQRLGTTAVAGRLVPYRRPTAPDFANPLAPRGDSKNSGTTIKQANDWPVRRDLESASVEFIDENGGGAGRALA
jgi:hypothetical protein